MTQDPHSKQFEIVRNAFEKATDKLELDGRSCPACSHATVTGSDKTRRFCIWDRCNALIVEDL